MVVNTLLESVDNMNMWITHILSTTLLITCPFDLPEVLAHQLVSLLSH